MEVPGEQLERLNAELDEALVSYFDLFTEYQTLHADLGNRLKNVPISTTSRLRLNLTVNPHAMQGWWELGRSRYAMGAGVNTLSQRQYPASMTATAHYHEADQHSAEETSPSAKDAGAQLHKRTKGAGEKEKSKKSKEQQPKQEGGGNAKGEGADTTETTKSDNGRERWKDPVNWFGLLPPPSLRVAQSEFKSAVEVVCSLTSVKRKLQAKQEEYTALLERKQQLTAQS